MTTPPKYLPSNTKENLVANSQLFFKQIRYLIFQNLLARIRFIKTQDLTQFLVPMELALKNAAKRQTLSQPRRTTTSDFMSYLIIYNKDGLEFDMNRDFCFSTLVTPPHSGPLHTHDYIEIFYVISGSFSQMLLGQTYTFSAGDIVVTDKNCEHADIIEAKDSAVLFLWLSTEYMEKLMKYSDGQSEFQRFLFHAISNKKREQSFLIFRESEKTSFQNPSHTYDVSIILERLIQEEYMNDSGSKKIMEGLLIRFFYALGRDYSLVRHTDERTSHEKLVLFELEKYIRECVSDVNASMLEEHFHYHRNYYNTILQKYRGMSLKEYIQDIRIKKACDLLQTTNLTIKEISHEVGYENTNFFYKLFQEKTGKKPKDYKNSAYSLSHN